MPVERYANPNIEPGGLQLPPGWMEELQKTEEYKRRQFDEQTGGAGSISNIAAGIASGAVRTGEKLVESVKTLGQVFSGDRAPTYEIDPESGQLRQTPVEAREGGEALGGLIASGTMAGKMFGKRFIPDDSGYKPPPSKNKPPGEFTPAETKYPGPPPEGTPAATKFPPNPKLAATNKEELIQHLDKNEFPIKVTTFGGKGEFPEDMARALALKMPSIVDSGQRGLIKWATKQLSEGKSIASVQAVFNKMPETSAAKDMFNRVAANYQLPEGVAGPSKFNRYSVEPGNSTYRDTVVSADLPYQKTIKELEAEKNRLNKLLDEAYDTRWTRPGREMSPTARVYEAAADQIDRRIHQLRAEEGYGGGHFGEVPDNLVHVRWTLQKDAQGKTVAAINEIQSDIGQEIRNRTHDFYAKKLFNKNYRSIQGTISDFKSMVKPETPTQKEYYDQIKKEYPEAVKQKAAITEAVNEAAKRGGTPAGARDPERLAGMRKQMQDETEALRPVLAKYGMEKKDPSALILTDNIRELLKKKFDLPYVTIDHVLDILSRDQDRSWRGGLNRIEADYDRFYKPSRITVATDAQKEIRTNKPLRDFLDEYSADVKKARALDSLALDIDNQRRLPPNYAITRTTDRWMNLAMDAAINEAIKAGAERIAIPSGATVKGYGMGGMEEGMNYAYDSMYPKTLMKKLRRFDKAVTESEESLYSNKGNKEPLVVGAGRYGPGEPEAKFRVYDITPNIIRSHKLITPDVAQKIKNVVAALPQGKGTAEQFKKEFTRAGISEAEMEATGIDAFLDRKTGRGKGELLSITDFPFAVFHDTQDDNGPTSRNSASPL